MEDPSATQSAGFLGGPSSRLVRNDTTTPSVDDYANVFGSGAYNIQPDVNRNRKYGRLQIPDVLKGPNQWITDRVDGLIADATNSPFTTIILPYMYMEYPDRKVEWNVWTFDQGLASRVPYESAARTLTQRKQSFSGYTVRQGLAITIEHNFMMTTEGMENFHNQIKQVVGSIQNTNDLDVHMALITAPSYMTQVRERYYLEDYMHKALRDYIDTFGFVQKNMNAMDIIIEDTKSLMKNWGGEEPDFMMCSNKLCFQLTMTQERTAYMTQGPDGKKLLKDGPTMDFYRGLKIVKSKAFSLEEGSAPRDIMRRRVRVGEFYTGHIKGLSKIEMYDEDSDNMESITAKSIFESMYDSGSKDAKDSLIHSLGGQGGDILKLMEHSLTAAAPSALNDRTLLLMRPNIEHYMLGVVIGKGGMDHLGATLWGQTEMSVFDDGQHGVWGMTYKYHERAMVFNEVCNSLCHICAFCHCVWVLTDAFTPLQHKQRNLHKVWDVAYDGYCGGKDLRLMVWDQAGVQDFIDASSNTSQNYEGPSIICLVLEDEVVLKSPLPICKISDSATPVLATSDMFIHDVQQFAKRQMKGPHEKKAASMISEMYDMLKMHNDYQVVKDAVMASSIGETTS